jgi:hypothetical protein
MNYLKSIAPNPFIASLIIVLIAGGFQLVYSQATETAIVNRFISRQAKKEGADEYREARKTLHGNINGDGKADLVVLYSLEGFGGGNSYSQYLAVFLGKGKTFQYAANAIVGGKLNRDVDLKSIASRRINLDTMEYRRNDAACCPSKKGTTRYIFANGKLKEVR